jgi:hypothetical protein
VNGGGCAVPQARATENLPRIVPVAAAPRGVSLYGTDTMPLAGLRGRRILSVVRRARSR